VNEDKTKKRSILKQYISCTFHLILKKNVSRLGTLFLATIGVWCMRCRNNIGCYWLDHDHVNYTVENRKIFVTCWYRYDAASFQSWTISNYW